MKKLFVSVVLSLIVSAVPMTVFARQDHCASVLVFKSGGVSQVCGLSGSFTQNGVLICEYDC